MTLDEVLPALKNLKRIKRKCHKSDVFLMSCNDQKIRLRKGHYPVVNKDYGLNADDILAEDWEIVN